MQAIELCEKAHQPWRAASIRGSIAFEWNALSELLIFFALLQMGH